jgi:ABC-2 type transport system ATP-binding protein
MILVENLRKTYGKVIALDGLSLKIRRGEVFGLLGPNGAGKTTLIRVLTSLTRASSGRAWINGIDLLQSPEEVKREVGLVPQYLNLDHELTAEENLDFYGRLHGMEARERRNRIKELLDFVELGGRSRDLVEIYSMGMKRRLLIARALMPRPRVLLLDEPTVGLDPQTRRKIWDLITALKNQGVTVLLTTHYIEEAERLCDRVGIIDGGRLIALGTPTGLKNRVGLIALEIMTPEGVKRRFFKNREIALEFGSRHYKNEKCDFLLREANLEDVFIELTGRRIRE